MSGSSEGEMNVNSFKRHCVAGLLQRVREGVERVCFGAKRGLLRGMRGIGEEDFPLTRRVFPSSLSTACIVVRFLSFCSAVLVVEDSFVLL